MLIIKNWTNNSLQQQGITLKDGTVLYLTIYFRAIQQGWFITKLTWQTFSLYNLRITNNVNMLLAWKNVLPFGLACVTKDGREPSLLQDFSSGASTLYVLETADVESLDNILAGIS